MNREPYERKEHGSLRRQVSVVRGLRCSLQCAKHFLFFFFVSNQQSDATSCLAGLSKPKLPSHLTTSGTGFTVARWEQSRVPLRTLFGWPLSYVTDQFWKNMVCVCVYWWGNIWNDGCWCGSKCSAFSWIVFNDSRVSCFLCLSHRVSPQNGIFKLRNWKNKIKRFS